MRVKLLCLIFLSCFSSMIFAANDVAIFAGGCFWCLQPPFDKTKGVVSTQVGYIGGKKPNPTYEAVSAGGSGYREAIKITYDPAKVSYKQLLHIFWLNVDPTDRDGQFCDRGDQYRSAVYTLNKEQAALAKASAEQIERKYRIPVYTQIIPATTFYPAEKYHQDYYKKKPVRYKFYRYRCGRDKRLKQLWKRKK